MLYFFLAGGICDGASPGLPFTEDFSDTSLMDPAETNANWSTEEQKVYMAWRRAQSNIFPFSSSGSDITADTHYTRAIALGDVDGDGDLDVVAGNWGQTNRLYLNNGTANPFSGVTGSVKNLANFVTVSKIKQSLYGSGHSICKISFYKGKEMTIFLSVISVS